MRVEVSPDVLAKLNATIQNFGSTSVVVILKLVQWVSDQPDIEIIVSILQIHPFDITAEVPERIFRQLKRPKESKTGLQPLLGRVGSRENTV